MLPTHLLLVAVGISLVVCLLAEILRRWLWPYFLLVFVLLCWPLRSEGAEAKQARVIYPLDPAFLQALRSVECSDRHLNYLYGDHGKAIGPYQIHFAYWEDAIGYAPEVGGSYGECQNEDYARKIVTAYLNRYGAAAIRSRDFEALARLHHGGPRGAHGTLSWRYWRKVKLAMYQFAQKSQ